MADEGSSTTSHAPIAGPLASGTTPSLTLARSLNCDSNALLSMPPFDLFVAQLSSDSTEARVDAMKKLSIVGDAMGTQETIERLIPYLDETIARSEDNDEDDEILLLLAGQLAELVPGLVPGYEALPLLPTLERLCCIDETVVRDKAVETLNKIVPLLLPGGRYEDGMPFAQLRTTAQRLASADWFTAKVSAAGVLPTMYAFWNAHAPRGAAADEVRREFRILFKDLSEDDTPMVRRSAAKNLGRFVEAVAGLTKSAEEMIKSGLAQPAIAEENKKLVAYEIVPIFQALSADEQDSVRLLAVSCAGSVGCGLAREPGNAEVVLPVVRGGCADLSWRVRHNLSKQFATVTGSLGFVGPKHIGRQTEVFQLFSGLLQDSEAEVRAAAVENIAHMAQLGGADLFQAHIAPLLPALADDLVMEVRSKLAQTLMDCCDPSICTALTDEIILQEFRPLLENFLNDEFAEVQLHILSKLSRVSHLLGQMDVVVNSILQMARAQNWRVRDAVGRLLPFLAEARGVAFFEDHLLEPWLKIMSDQVADVRAACIAGMPKLLSVCGSEWIMQEILPNYTRMYDESHSYLTRITVLRSFAALAEQDGENALNIRDALMEQIVSIMLRGLTDSVPNVRLIAARGLGLVTISGQCDSGLMKSKIVPALNDLVHQEQDIDCRYQCQLALEAKV